MKLKTLARNATKFSLTIAVASAALVTVGVSPASAQAHSGPCYTGDICYFQANYRGGSQAGMQQYEVADVENPWVTFQTPGTGQGQGVGNNAGSIQNLDLDSCWRVYEDEYFRGRYDRVPKYGTLQGWFVTQNNNRAHAWGTGCA